MYQAAGDELYTAVLAVIFRLWRNIFLIFLAPKFHRIGYDELGKLDASLH